jgi:crotonobetainyl-CoA:carnitine CoA-transferase CaiB-like acyl-CoA transferase
MRPLHGVRVLDLTRLIPGPFGTLVLAELGAQVDKIEDPGAGDYLRHIAPSAGKGHGSVAFAALNRGKRSGVIDVKNPRGRDALLRLAGGYDVLFEQFRPGVMSRLGLGHEVLRAAHPRLIVCALTGYGQTGPLKDRAGHDLNYLARAGILGLQGPASGPPQVPAFQLADVAGGMWCAIAILAALRERDATGQGRVCDIAMADGAAVFAALSLAAALNGESPRRGDETLSGGIAPYNSYLSRDGVPMSLAPLEPKFWLAFSAAVGLEPDLTALLPGPHQAALKERLAAIIAGRTRAEWEAFAAEYDCLLEPAIPPNELASDPQLCARGLFPTSDEEGVTYFRTPVSDPAAPLGRAPGRGEHTRAIFAEAGFSEGEIDELYAAKAIA